MRNRKVLFLLFGIFLAVIGFHSRVCIAATQTNNHPQISENYLDSAIVEGDLRIVRAALERGYSVNYRIGNIDSPTLLIEAAGFGYPGIVQFLLAHDAAVNAHTTTGETALWQAANADLADNDDGVNIALGHPTPPAVLEAGRKRIAANYAKIIRLLLDHGANPNTPDNNGVTPLDVACYRNRIAGVEALLNSHADLNHRDDFGKTPVEWASYNGYPEIVKMLLAHGAHVDAKRGLPGEKQRKLDEALDNAINRHSISAIKLLLSRGADSNCSLRLYPDLNALDHMEMMQLITPLFLSANSPLITRMLLAKGADPNKCDDNKYTPLMAAVGSNYVQATPFPVAPEVAQILIEHGANVNARDATSLLTGDDGKTALMQTHNETCLHLLIAHGADINARNAEGRTALIMATDQTWGEGSMAACDAPWVQVLLRHGAKVNIQDANGNTALMLLAAQGEYGYYNRGEPELLAHLLLANSANLNIRNKRGRTVWQIAKDRGAKTLLNQLRRHVRYVTKQKQH
jgi:ankyrin repeat protein